MTALTTQITSRTLVAAVLTVALAGLMVALVLGITATSGRSAGNQESQSTSVSHPAPGTGFRLPGCLVCYR
jgi:F0F1-type ATP synthase membrane subunit c/vacuolar-type H+-ATPase subunit K